MINPLKDKLRRKFLKKALELVDLDDILVIKGEKAFIGDYELDEADRRVLRDDARYFEGSFFWKRLSKFLKWRAIQQSLGEGDLKGGQDIMLTLRAIQDFLDDCGKKL